MDNRYANKFYSFRDHWNYDDVSEDCLRINVFTPALNDGKKRPVTFWIHGGGYTNGNGIEHDGYNGENLARFGDVVFCSINHRLGPLGYCNLAAVGGENFVASGNVGMLDIVAALEWVRDNIANFGGDPGNVTIMGQSGGGAKVCVLTAMPSAKALFHKAVVLSGASVRAERQDLCRKARLLCRSPRRASPRQTSTKLQEMPWKEFYGLATRAQQKLTAEMSTNGRPAAGLRFGFSPSVDGTFLPQHPYDPDAAPTASAVPMIICSTVEELSSAWMDPAVRNLTVPEVVQRLKERAGFGPGLGDNAQAVVDAYMKEFPDRKPYEILTLVSSNRQSVVTLADAKAEAAGAGLRQLVRVAAAALRRAHRRLSLRGHLLLVLQHRPHAHAHGRRRQTAPALGQNGGRARAIHEDGRSKRQRARLLAEIHERQRRDARPGR